MGGDSLDAQLEPIAQFLLVVIALIIVASLTSYILFKVVQRRKDKAHNKLSASRRDKDSGINLFEAPQRTRRRSSGSKSRSSLNLVQILRDFAETMNTPKSGRRGKRRRKSSHQMIDMGKRSEDEGTPT